MSIGSSRRPANWVALVGAAVTAGGVLTATALTAAAPAVADDQKLKQPIPVPTVAPLTATLPLPSPGGIGSLTPAPSAKDSFADVVAVGSASGYHCTGVLVARSWVLTARHCLPATVVLFGNEVGHAVAIGTVKGSRTPPDPALDAALLQLTSPAGYPPRVYRPAGATAPPRGTVRLLGFGADDATGTHGLGVKRAVEMPVFGWGCDVARAATTGCRASEEMVIPRRGYQDTCDGDSGGPVFESFNGAFRLVGITSRPVPTAASRCGNGGIYTRIDRIAGWLALITSSPDGASR